ncbi:MAG: right-handed parallel beta-helix repeat-containing protein, partial [Planctomycetes bacterium]|nr:right-handed parallel beta-helix repeat-containing protein [Planctomycetota bacterium]
WKHHPWDSKSSAKAKACSGIHSYIFKGGSIYRGSLIADDSGSSSESIQLTRDPKWGKGAAIIAGSQRISSAWKKANDAPQGMPESDKVWVCDVKGFKQITGIWSADSQRVKLARHPNWTLSNKEDVKAEWASWDKTWMAPKQKRTFISATQSQLGNQRVICQSTDILNAKNTNAYAGATVWTEYCGLMGSPYPGPVLNFNPDNHTIMVGAPWMGTNFPIENCRFFLENHPRFLDQAGEYWHDVTKGQLYIRLADDLDPNTSGVDVTTEINLIDLSNQKNITISGLGFQHQRVAQWHKRFWDVPEEDGACIKSIGNSHNINIHHNTFIDVVRAVWIQGANNAYAIDHININDNEMRNCDWDCIIIYPHGKSHGNLGNVNILRNNMEEIGERPRRAAHGHALQVRYARSLNLAGNIIKRSFGTAIFLHGGKPSGSKGDAKLCRMLVFDNLVEDTCLTNNDWGGIETWQGGPAYVYNNVSLRPHGYWHSVNQITNDNWQDFNRRWDKEYPSNKFTQLNKPRAVAGMWDRGMRNASSAG